MMRQRVRSVGAMNRALLPPIAVNMGASAFRNAAGSQPSSPSSPSFRVIRPTPQSPTSRDAVIPPPDLSEYVKPVDKRVYTCGGYGDVWMGRLEMGAEIYTVAVKHLRCPPNSSVADRRRMDLRLRREILVWKRLRHENIVRLLGTVHHNDSTGMVSTWMTSGNLNIYARTDLPLSRRLQIPCDIAAGLAYLHSQGIIHGDLNGGNALIDDNGRARLVDFGLSVIKAEFDGTSLITSTVGGAVRYLAPDLLPPSGTSDDVYNFVPNLTFACDIWSLGSLILQALSGEMPYYSVARDVWVIMLITNGIRPLRPPADALTDNYWKYINHLWSDAPGARPRADEAHMSLLALRDLHDPPASLTSRDVIPRPPTRMSQSRPNSSMFSSPLAD